MGQLVVRNHQCYKYTSTIFMKYIFLDFTFWSYEVRSERSGSSSRMVTKVLSSSQEFLHHLYQTTKIQNILEATNRELFIEVHVILLLTCYYWPNIPTRGWLVRRRSRILRSLLSTSVLYSSSSNELLRREVNITNYKTNHTPS